MGSIPGRGTKVPQTVRHDQKREKRPDVSLVSGGKSVHWEEERKGDRRVFSLKELMGLP